MSASSINPRDLRVSDAERSHVMAILEKATGRGLLTLNEYSDRSAAAVTAKTRAELNSVLVDLPGILVAGRELHPPTSP
ncbi:DUF1707 domain-containing protein [Nakamurella antarctica]|uniref:DUF1707 domain-containing protein n=1 Tax=Nakamurella antarctica TaxID=1902245 RepID=A0A3G8ZIK2_9ACTN|nr:DUF1707 domain-containing protein [Nakamurella antarctica]AZI57040.1 DUF1707 domain-containing protein [Nakamurella antarctica]